MIFVTFFSGCSSGLGGYDPLVRSRSTLFDRHRHAHVFGKNPGSLFVDFFPHFYKKVWIFPVFGAAFFCEGVGKNVGKSG